MWLSEDPTSSKGEGGRGAANPSPFMKKWVHTEGHTFDLCPRTAWKGLNPSADTLMECDWLSDNSQHNNNQSDKTTTA